MEQLAKNLVQKYPKLGDSRRDGNGWEMWFLHSAHAKAATGFLEERLKSQRRKLTSRKETRNISTLQDLTLNWNSEEEDGKYLFDHECEVMYLNASKKYNKKY